MPCSPFFRLSQHPFGLCLAYPVLPRAGAAQPSCYGGNNNKTKYVISHFVDNVNMSLYKTGESLVSPRKRHLPVSDLPQVVTLIFGKVLVSSFSTYLMPTMIPCSMMDEDCDIEIRVLPKSPSTDHG